jgi:hypothetical protein
VTDVAVDGPFAYLALSRGPDYLVVDVSDPTNPRVVGNVALPGAVTDVTIAAERAYVTSYDAGFQVLALQCDGITGVYSAGAAAPDLIMFPNPTSGATSLRFSWPAAASATVSIFDARGRRVRALTNCLLRGGSNDLGWDGRDDAGRDVAAGTYLARIEAGDQVRSGRIVILH